MIPSRATILAALCLLVLAGWLSPALTLAGSVTLDDLAWIAGDWVGGEEDTLIEERWSAPAGDNMMGMFRLVKDGKVVFYEFMSIETGPEGPILRIKHFNPGLAGWEAKDESVTFDLGESGDQRAVFETEMNGDPEMLVYEREADELVITLLKPAKDSRSEFRYQQRRPPKAGD